MSSLAILTASVFTERHYASAVYAAIMSPSVTSRSFSFEDG